MFRRCSDGLGVDPEQWVGRNKTHLPDGRTVCLEREGPYAKYSLTRLRPCVLTRHQRRNLEQDTIEIKGSVEDKARLNTLEWYRPHICRLLGKNTTRTQVLLSSNPSRRGYCTGHRCRPPTVREYLAILGVFKNKLRSCDTRRNWESTFIMKNKSVWGTGRVREKSWETSKVIPWKRECQIREKLTWYIYTHIFHYTYPSMGSLGGNHKLSPDHQ